MLNLQNIDCMFSQQLRDLELIIQNYDFENQFEFILGPNIDYNHLGSLDYPGVYMFEIKTDSQMLLADWLSYFQKEWEHDSYKKMAVPSIKIKRIKSHTQAKEWIPLYIGKSRCISNRVKEHLCMKLKQPTTALKLLERENLYNQVFRVSTIRVEVKNYDLIVPQFESILRNSIHPIVGRQ